MFEKKKRRRIKNETKKKRSTSPKSPKISDRFPSTKSTKSVEINSKGNLSFSSSRKNLEKIGDSDFEGPTIDAGEGGKVEARGKEMETGNPVQNFRLNSSRDKGPIHRHNQRVPRSCRFSFFSHEYIPREFPSLPNLALNFSQTLG